MAIPRISQAEWDIMNVLWETAPLAAGQVVEQFAGRKEWSPRTIKSMLSRLVRKGALAFQQQGNHYLYRPKVTRDECVRHESRSFLSRVFDGQAGVMLAHFVDTGQLKPADIDALKQTLTTKENPHDIYSPLGDR